MRRKGLQLRPSNGCSLHVFELRCDEKLKRREKEKRKDFRRGALVLRRTRNTWKIKMFIVSCSTNYVCFQSKLSRRSFLFAVDRWPWENIFNFLKEKNQLGLKSSSLMQTRIENWWKNIPINWCNSTENWLDIFCLFRGLMVLLLCPSAQSGLPHIVPIFRSLLSFSMLLLETSSVCCLSHYRYGEASINSLRFIRAKVWSIYPLLKLAFSRSYFQYLSPPELKWKLLPFSMP